MVSAGIGETTTISTTGAPAIREENLPILSETHSEQKTEEKPDEEPSFTSLGITGDYDLGQLGILTEGVQDYISSLKLEVGHRNNIYNFILFNFIYEVLNCNYVNEHI